MNIFAELKFEDYLSAQILLPQNERKIQMLALRGVFLNLKEPKEQLSNEEVLMALSTLFDFFINKHTVCTYQSQKSESISGASDAAGVSELWSPLKPPARILKKPALTLGSLKGRGVFASLASYITNFTDIEACDISRLNAETYDTIPLVFHIRHLLFQLWSFYNNTSILPAVLNPLENFKCMQSERYELLSKTKITEEAFFLLNDDQKNEICPAPSSSQDIVNLITTLDPARLFATNDTVKKVFGQITTLPHSVSENIVSNYEGARQRKLKAAINRHGSAREKLANLDLQLQQQDFGSLSVPEFIKNILKHTNYDLMKGSFITWLSTTLVKFEVENERLTKEIEQKRQQREKTFQELKENQQIADFARLDNITGAIARIQEIVNETFFFRPPQKPVRRSPSPTRGTLRRPINSSWGPHYLFRN